MMKMRQKGLIKLTILVLAALFATAAAAAEAGGRSALTFVPVDVYVNAGNAELGAFQFEIVYDPSIIYLVGVEGGDAPFAQAPYYDPRGLTGGTIRIAGFTVEPQLPTGLVRVARLHLAVSGDAGPGGHEGISAVTLTVAANPGHDHLDATINLEWPSIVMDSIESDADGQHREE